MQKKNKRKLNIFAVASLILAGIVFMFACTKNEPEMPIEHPLDGDGEINYAAMPGLKEVPEEYGCSIFVKIKAEFVIYLDEKGSLLAYEIKNNEAMKVAERAFMEGACFEVTREIFRMSIDELSIDTETEDMQVALTENNLSDEEGSEMLQRAIDGANAALEERNKTGKVNYSFPDDMAFINPKTQSENNENKPEENIRPEEKHPNFDKDKEEWICASQSDLDSVIDFLHKNNIGEGSYPIKISKDITLSLNTASAYKDIVLDCNGQNVTINGNFSLDIENFQPLCIENAKSVDLSGLTVDMESATKLKPAGPRPGETEEEAYWNTQNSIVDIVRIKGTPQSSIIIPELFEYPQNVERNEKNSSFFDPYCEYEVKDNEILLKVIGPRDDYEARNEKEIKVLEEIFTNGEYHSLTGQTSNNFYYICTDVTMDIGECTLPNMDYEAICVGKGGHLVLTGTLYITGGTFKMETYQHDGIDIRGLTIVKKHPSPDMIQIGFDPEEGIDEELYKCKTSSGEVKFSKGSDKVSITVW